MNVTFLAQINGNVDVVSVEMPCVPRIGEQVALKFTKLKQMVNFKVRGVLYNCDDDNAFKDVVVAVEF